MDKVQLLNVEEMMDGLNHLIDRLGVGVESVWPWFVRQVYVDFLVSAVWFLLASATLTSLAVFRVRILEWIDKDYDYNGRDLLWGFLFAASLIFVIISVCVFLCQLSNVLNPEVAAMKDMVGMVISHCE